MVLPKMNSSTILFTLVLLGIITIAQTQMITPAKSLGWRQIVQVGVGDYCLPAAAPVGPGGSFQVIEQNVEKICAAGTSCRKGACNCDDLRDGTVTGISSDQRGTRSCRRVAGQRCSNDNQCFHDVRCVRGICTCDRNRNEFCVDRKNDVYILV